MRLDKGRYSGRVEFRKRPGKTDRAGRPGKAVLRELHSDHSPKSRGRLISHQPRARDGALIATFSHDASILGVSRMESGLEPFKMTDLWQRQGRPDRRRAIPTTC